MMMMMMNYDDDDEDDININKTDETCEDDDYI